MAKHTRAWKLFVELFKILNELKSLTHEKMNDEEKKSLESYLDAEYDKLCK